ncbi:hypothetical protein E0Z10_g88 [Xylaria hypoxylon]|uniref:Uncharacterized protein n=1 Tax=Xylaria hypoxylon TaxID=37992 RepID=A0A4Z0ZG16_9PEZI|nr:hypothetical protein E0Z10_g88 [Xylaria hypoxylon]
MDLLDIDSLLSFYFTLPCLCPAQSISGFTVGEAALQCLVGYAQLGLCDEQDAGGPAPARVLNMCSGQESALPNTHPTLTATLVVPPSGDPNNIENQHSLTISHYQSKFFFGNHNHGDDFIADSNSDFNFDFNSDFKSDGKPNFRAVVSHTTGAGSDSRNFYFIPRAAPSAPSAPQAAQPEPPIQSPKIDRSTIGLAISRPRSLLPPRPSPKIHSPAMSSPRQVEVLPQRRPSKLLPPRPALTLNIPSKAVTSSAPSSQAPPTTDRASTFTNLTGFADLDSEAAEGEQTWRPPPTDPLSATTLYIADKYGNWVLSNDRRRSQIAQITQAVELDTHTPLTKSPIEKQEEVAKMAAAISATTALPRAPRPAFLSQDPANQTYSQSSSLYSQASATRQTGRRNSFGRSSVSRSRKSGGGPGINRSDSKASVTTIQTSSTGGNDDGTIYENDIARLSQLSPVEESPDPATKRPRITYPKITGRLDGATIRYVPPPRRPSFTGSPSGQPSPTLGAVYTGEGSPSAYPLPLNPKRKGRRFASTEMTGSGFTPEPPNVEVFPLQDYARSNEMLRPEPYLRPGPASTQPTGSYRYVDSQQRDPFRTPPHQTIPTFTPSPPSPSSKSPSPPSEEKRSVTPPQPRIIDRGRPHIASQRVVSGTSFGTVSSTASSLLAKRLGSNRASALVLDPNGKKSQQWRRQAGGGDNGLLSPYSLELSSPKGTLPQTPIWQPKLTPTRWGDDLYLNVQ